MSFELFMQCYDNGEPSGVPANAVRTAFSNLAEDSEEDYWHLRYAADDDCHIAVSRPGGLLDQISGLTVFRPCGDSRFWESLYRVLQLGRWVLYFPAEPPPLIMANRIHSEHLPASMLEALGPVREVHSGDDIRQIIRSS
jgi:hypothetical protein